MLVRVLGFCSLPGSATRRLRKVEHFTPGDVPIGQPLIVDPSAVGAQWATFGPGGQPSYFAAPDTPGATYVRPFYPLPNEPPSGPPPGSLEDWRLRGSATTSPLQPMPSLPPRYIQERRFVSVSEPTAAAPPPVTYQREQAWLSGRNQHFVRHRRSFGERLASFGHGVLALLGSATFSVPPWLIIVHDKTADQGNAMSLKGTMQAVVGIWAFVSVIVGLVGLCCFIGGLAILLGAGHAEE